MRPVVPGRRTPPAMPAELALMATLPRRSLLGLTCLLASATGALAETPAAVATRLAAEVTTLERDYLAPALLEKRIQVTARLNDGLILYQTKDFERAAMVLLDVVENPLARGLPAYREALFYLADSLFKLRNFHAAAGYFEELVKVGSTKEKQLAVGRLVEVALAAHDNVAAERHLAQAQALLGTAPEPALLYAVGKYRYELGQLEIAGTLLSRIPAGGALSTRARYLQAVIDVRQGKLDAAQQTFSALVDGATQASANPVDRRVTDLARLALGRLAYERGDLTAAVSAYASVRQDSAVFDEALYETVWIEVKRQDYARALRKLEVQLIVKPDVLDGPDARLLQGKLLMMLGRFDEASRAFDEVLVQFGPLQDEMRLTVRKHGHRLEQHLNESLGGDLGTFESGRFLPAKAARFAGADPETDRAVNLVTDLALQRRDLTEAERLAEQLGVALESGSRVKIFPRLQQGWLRGLELQHQVAFARAALNDEAARGIKKDEAFKALKSKRKGLQARYEAVPRSAVAIRARTARVDDQMARLDQAAFRLSVEIQGLDAQLTAIDKYVKDTVGGEAAAAGLPALTQVQAERRTTLALRAELEALVDTVEAERIRLGVSDDASGADDRIRTAFLDAARAEARWLVAHGAQFPSATVSQLDAVDGRLSDFFAKAGQLVDDRVADIKAQVERERRNVASHGRELGLVAGESESIGGAVAARAFRQVLTRVGNVVLEADVGLIDVAWKQKQDQSDEISKVLDRQQADLQLLDEAYQELSRD